MLGDDFDELDGNELPENVLTINKKFAEKFESRERNKELARAKYVLADDEEDGSSDSESDEDDDGEMLDPALDAKIVQTINSIRKKDPKIYDKNAVWFNQDVADEDSDSDKGAEEKKAKKKHYKDVLREQLLKHGADIDDNDGSKYSLDSHRSKKSLAYDAEQERLRKAFLKEAVDQNSDDEDDDEEDNQEFFAVKAKDPAQQAKDEEELKKALEEMKALGGEKSEVKDSADKDAFLVDYISKKKWKFEPIAERRGRDQKEDEDDDGEETGSRDIDYEQDEEELDKMEMFESKYNFRFEELQGAGGDTGGDGSLTSTRGGLGLGANAVQVIGHARNVEGSVRRVEDKRKQQREERKERKEKERRQKEAELRRLKNLKKQELQERLKHICEVGGLKEMGLDEVEAALDEDWDPAKYEAMMQARFGADYYDQEEEDEIFRKQLDKGKGNSRKAVDGGDDADDDDQMDDEPGFEEGDDNELNSKSSGAPSKSQLSNMMDELYKLDYEDIVAGMPCRFKYRQVAKEDFGLTADEILLAEDAELNQFVSLKKISAYRDNSGVANDGKVAKKRKRLRVALRERLKKEAEEAAAAGLTQKGTKPVKAKKDGDDEGAETGDGASAYADDNEDQKSSRRRRRRRKGENKDAPETEAESSSDKRQRTNNNSSNGSSSNTVDAEGEGGGDSRPPRPHQKQQKPKDKIKKKKDAASASSSSAKPNEKQRRMNLYD